ncbi:MAG: hypothetical protein HXX15_12830 [Rhodopseudomonas sp.]|uniref:hypothetical protein n=1 Tax=Rhodopseudomonas sp. TaxID=1078 RepID=UPI0018120013|nr:hypothetical protein [Rhodopseudomonas sp.]NVN86958.1 hypothetical protein [Rhodopseudomonas sp.]
MTLDPCATPRQQAVDIMIDLARLTRSHRIAVAGSESVQIHRHLHRRGFARCSIVGSGVQFGRYSAALIAGDRSHQALEASLARVSPLLDATASVVVSIDSEEKGLSLRVRTRLDQLRFRIEAGVRCQQAFLLSAYRCNVASIAKAA